MEYYCLVMNASSSLCLIISDYHFLRVCSIIELQFDLYGLDALTPKGNVLSKALLLEHLRGLLAVKATTAQYKGRTHLFADLCVKVAVGSTECQVRAWRLSGQ